MSLYENLLAEVPDTRIKVAVPVSSAGGRTRYLWLDLRDVQDRYQDPSGPIRCLLFKTEVATVWPDRMVLNSGGFRTVTTKDAFNWLANKGSGHYVYSEDHAWWVYPNGWSGKRDRLLFVDDMEIDLTGRG